MTNTIKNSPQGRRPIARAQNPYETAAGRRPNSLGKLATDIGQGIAQAGADIATGAIDSMLGTPQPTRRRQHPVNAMQPQEMSANPDNGGVRIPTFEDYRKQQEARNNQFFEMKRQEEEAARKKHESEDQRQLEEVYKELEKEIKRYEAAQNKLDENIDKLKKLIIAERTNKYKKGVYAFTIADIGRMIMQTLLIDIGKANNWLEAVVTKKKKRGSLFAVRSKKQGTQYSMSQELSLTRSVQ